MQSMEQKAVIPEQNPTMHRIHVASKTPCSIKQKSCEVCFSATIPRHTTSDAQQTQHKQRIPE
jgi:hypothetical protein